MKACNVSVGQKVKCNVKPCCVPFGTEGMVNRLMLLAWHDGTYGRYYRPGHLGTIKTEPKPDQILGEECVWVEWDEKYQDGVWLIEVKHIEPIFVE